MPHECFGSAHVDQYAAFVRESADDVADKVLNCVFSKDRDFQKFLKTPQAKQAASALRVRKAPSNGATEQLPNEAYIRGGDHEFCTGDEGVTLPQLRAGARAVLRTGRSLTPPALEGNCRATASKPPR